MIEIDRDTIVGKEIENARLSLIDDVAFLDYEIDSIKQQLKISDQILKLVQEKTLERFESIRSKITKNNKMFVDLDKLAAATEQKINDDITDRMGWRQEWGQFNHDIQEEIRTKYKSIIIDALEKAQVQKWDEDAEIGAKQSQEMADIIRELELLLKNKENTSERLREELKIQESLRIKAERKCKKLAKFNVEKQKELDAFKEWSEKIAKAFCDTINEVKIVDIHKNGALDAIITPWRHYENIKILKEWEESKTRKSIEYPKSLMKKFKNLKTRSVTKKQKSVKANTSHQMSIREDILPSNKAWDDDPAPRK